MRRVVLSAAGVCALTLSVSAQDRWLTDEGVITYDLNAYQLETLGLAHSVIGTDDTNELTFSFPLNADAVLAFQIGDDGLVQFTGGHLAHFGILELSSGNADFNFPGMAIRPALRDDGQTALIASSSAVQADAPGLEITHLKAGFDRAAQTLTIEAADLTISPELAEVLGEPALAGQSIGSVSIVVAASSRNAPGSQPIPVPQGGNNGTVCPTPVGPDVIVGDMPSVCNFTPTGGIDAITIGTTSCNVGDANVLWQSSNPNHPVIGQNMYRLKNGRFEQIGISWLKHGFTALTGNICGCTCSGQGGSVLGVGCSDPYGCGLNSSQGLLGPRFEVNAFTGVFLYPFTGQNQTGNDIYKRCQVHLEDLDPAMNPGAVYYGDTQYVTADDAQAENGDNNCSYRKIVVTGSASNANASFIDSTVREFPAIYAWQVEDPSVQIVPAHVPGEGLFVLGAKASLVSGNVWHYEYALFNMNSDRSARSFSVPFPGGTQVTNVGFHDVDYHSGEPFVGTDWNSTSVSNGITWSTDSFIVNQNANALRWGTLYNFRFDANVAPVEDSQITIGLFKPGAPTNFTVDVIGPPLGPPDCNFNGVPDPIDIGLGTSDDCNDNDVPDECEVPPLNPTGHDCNLDLVPDDCQLAGNDCDENEVPDDCEPDCNNNKVADACDIGSGSSGDCDTNGVPDECQADCNNNGIPNTCEPGAVIFEDDFETDQGWTVQNDASLTDGAWERGDPGQTLFTGTVIQPEDDHSDPGTLCYVTDATGTFTNSSDVDGGPTYLTSPTLDLSDGGATLEYYYWFQTTNGTPDVLDVQVSGDGGGHWTTIATHATPQSSWRFSRIEIDPFITPTATTTFRFAVADPANNSYTEALIDDVVVYVANCPEGEPVITAGWSLKDHNGTGTFAMDLLAGEGEDREGGPTHLTVEFDQDVFAADGTPSPNDVSVSSGAVTDVMITDNIVDIVMNGADNLACLAVGFPGLESSKGNPVTDALSFEVVYGDVDHDGQTGASDVVQSKAHSNPEEITAATADFDVNVDGVVGVGDVTAAKSSSAPESADCD